MIILGTELYGKTAGIIGVGAIGEELARILRGGFQMEILANDVVQRTDLTVKYGVECVDIDTIFSQSDYISIHTPLLSSTRRLVNADKLGLMKQTAFIINVARGGVLDEEALLFALKNKTIAGAGLDVYSQEPPQDCRFIKCDNVVLTPHVAGDTLETVDRISKILTDVIRDVMAGKAPETNVVNPEVFK